MSRYDVIVIGAGPGGYVSAIRASQLGANVCIIEEGELGGVCLNRGCIPTKTLIYSAELFHKFQNASEYGIIVDSPKLDMQRLLDRKDKVITANRAGVASLLKLNRVDVLNGKATITAPNTIEVNGESIIGKSIIIATGSKPAQIPGIETDGERVITSTEALDLKAIPESVAIIGAGPLGAEFACLWNTFGSEVTLIEMMPNVLPKDDSELTKRLAGLMKRRGIRLRLETKVSALEHTPEGIRMELECKKPDSIVVDLVLVGIGFSHNSELISDPESMGIEIGERGEILVDDHMETGAPNVYAIGDVVGKTMLAHGASAEGLVAAVNATGGNEKMDYRVVPWCSFTMPEVSHVGLTEEEAVNSGIEVKIGRFSYRANGRAQAMGEIDGMVKIIGDASTDEVVGVHIMGASAGELIASAALAMSMEGTVREIAHTIHTHPTLSETIFEAAEDYLGMGIHTPPKLK